MTMRGRVRWNWFCAGSLALGAAVVVPIRLWSQESAQSESRKPRTANFGSSAAVSPSTVPRAVTPPLIPATHPLARVLKFAREEQSYLRRAVRDSTCRLVKRERIEGTLQDYQYIDMRVVEEISQGETVVSPLKVSLAYLAPADVAGRKVVYVGGENDGKLLVRNGGRRFRNAIVKIDPFGEVARSESLIPITEIGFGRMLDRMIDLLAAHAEADPIATNTEVQFFKHAKIDDRPCDGIRITHPVRHKGLHFHLANVYVDTELHVPVRIDVCDWPENAGGEPSLLAEYTYTNLQLNVGLSPELFERSALHAK
jgi:hypothetical protein